MTQIKKQGLVVAMKELNRHQYVWLHINQDWLHLHIKNKRYYKGGTNDKTHDSHIHDSGVSRSDDDSVAKKTRYIK